MTTTQIQSPADSLVPSREHYGAEYLGASYERLQSYQHQLLYALSSRPRSILLVGKGDGIVENILRASGVAVTTLDIAADLQPDVVGSVDDIPLPVESVDVSICCQVLEHLPFERFQPSLRELRRVTRSRLVLSIPDVRRFVSLKLRMPKLAIDWQVSLPRLRPKPIPRSRTEELGHYWELGYAGADIAQVRRAIAAAGWRIEKHRRIHDLAWHSFFDCAAR